MHCRGCCVGHAVLIEWASSIGRLFFASSCFRICWEFCGGGCRNDIKGVIAIRIPISNTCPDMLLMGGRPRKGRIGLCVRATAFQANRLPNSALTRLRVCRPALFRHFIVQPSRMRWAGFP